MSGPPATCSDHIGGEPDTGCVQFHDVTNRHSEAGVGESVRDPHQGDGCRGQLPQKRRTGCRIGVVRGVARVSWPTEILEDFQASGLQERLRNPRKSIVTLAGRRQIERPTALVKGNAQVSQIGAQAVRARADIQFDGDTPALIDGRGTG